MNVPFIAVSINKSVNQQRSKFLRVSNWAMALSLIVYCGLAPRNAYAKPTAMITEKLFNRVLVQNKSQQPQDKPQEIFEDIKIEPQLSPISITMNGISGGSVPARSISERIETPTGSCIGFVDKEPNHKVVLTDFFDALSWQVESSMDTTIMIKGPGGIWCNDDYQGKNPGVSGQWQTGTYYVWVGSYKKDDYHSYRIKIFEEQP